MSKDRLAIIPQAVLTDGYVYDDKDRKVWLPGPWARAKLSGSAIKCYIVLAMHADNNGQCYPSLDTISRLSGVHRASVPRAIAQLERAGLITCQHSKGGCGPGGEYRDAANTYTMTIPTAEAVAEPLPLEGGVSSSQMACRAVAEPQGSSSQMACRAVAEPLPERQSRTPQGNSSGERPSSKAGAAAGVSSSKKGEKRKWTKRDCTPEMLEALARNDMESAWWVLDPERTPAIVDAVPDDIDDALVLGDAGVSAGAACRALLVQEHIEQAIEDRRERERREAQRIQREELVIDRIGELSREHLEEYRANRHACDSLTDRMDLIRRGIEQHLGEDVRELIAGYWPWEPGASGHAAELIAEATFPLVLAARVQAADQAADRAAREAQREQTKRDLRRQAEHEAKKAQQKREADRRKEAERAADTWFDSLPDDELLGYIHQVADDAPHPEKCRAWMAKDPRSSVARCEVCRRFAPSLQALNTAARASA